MKFLSIISVFNLFFSAIPFFQTKIKDGINTINLYTISLDKIEFNINDIERSYNYYNLHNEKNLDENSIFSNVLKKEISLNRLDEKLTYKLNTINSSFQKNPSDWKLLMPKNLPKVHESLDFTIKADYKNTQGTPSELIDGKLSLDVRFINSKVTGLKDVWDVLSSRKLEVKQQDFLYKDEKDVIWQKIYYANIDSIKSNSLNMKDFTFVKITYRETVLKIKDLNQKFYGVCIFEYESLIDLSSVKLNTKPISATSNRDHFTDEKIYKYSISYNPILGKEALLDSYNSINYKFNAKISCTGLQTKVFNFKSSHFNSVGPTFTMKQWPMKTYEHYESVCSLFVYTNHITISGSIYFYTSWIGNKLIITVKVEVFSSSDYELFSGGIATVSDLSLSDLSFFNDF